MARSRPKRRQSEGESKKALIIFLVFFILTTIGGGLFGYYGYYADENKQKTIKGLEDQKTQLGLDKQFLEYQALLYRRYLGQENKADKAKLDDYRRELDQKARWTSRAEINDVITVSNNVEKKLKAVAQEKPAGPGKDLANYEQALDFQAELTHEARKALAPLTEKQTVDRTRAEDLERQLKDVKAIYDKKLAELNTNLNQQTETSTQKIKDLETVVAQKDMLLGEKDQLIAKARSESKSALDRMEADIKRLKGTIAERDRELAKNSPSGDLETANLQLRPVGHVIDRRGEAVYIDLGLNQKLTPQMTFSVHAIGPDGSPLPASKGSIEVINVFEAGSQAHVQLERNKNNTIAKGDVLVNPNWNPNRKKHIAIAGVVDMTGEGRDQMREFRQLLAQQNVELDAFLEQVGDQWAVQGKGITRETNYLILGDSLQERRDQSKASETLDKQISEMKKQAINSGVIVLHLNNYLDMIGYQPPRGTGDISRLPVEPPAPPKKEGTPPPGDKGAMPPPK